MKRSMDNLDQLSDAELRHRLIQYGFPNMPVTDTTRKILIKKLRNHLNNEKAKLRRETSNVTRYSSDEESDLDARRTKARSMEVKSNTRKSTIYNNNMPPPVSPLVIGRRATTTSLLGRSPISRSNEYTFNSNQNTKSKIFVPPPILATDSDEDSDYSNYKSKTSFNSRCANSPSLSTSTYGNYCLTPDRSQNDSWSTNRYSSSPIYSNNQPLINGETEDTPNGRSSYNEDSPYTSDFTRRLLNLRGETIRNSILNKRDARQPLSLRISKMGPDATDIVQQAEQQKSDMNISPGTAFSNLISRLDEQYGVKQTFVPCILVSALLIFFALVAFTYMTISPDLANTIDDKNTIYNICNTQKTQSNLAPTMYTCVDQGSLSDALVMLKLVAPELQKRAEEHYCVDKSKSNKMSAKEVIYFMNSQKGSFDVRKTMKNLHDVEYLIEKNPQWKISHIDSNGNLLSFQEVLQLRNSQGNYFAILNPRLPLTCSLYNKLQIFFLFVGSLSLVGLGLGLIFLSYKFIIKQQQSKQYLVTQLIDEIICDLTHKAGNDPNQSSVVVNHLRDKLIPFHKRKQMEWAWNEAIRFLEQNESRVQFEMGIRNGEDCKMIKWIDTVSPEQIGQRSAIKKWHSPAFDKTNKIANPPTSCLKIRQMFDKFEANNPNLKTIIQDAILEKVGSDCQIYDIQLDKQSCCVYVRCASEKDAGIVHNEINGWWFDKRLVSIKFLRLERYLSRFPKSLSGPTCLRPSNTNNLSISQCSMDYGAGNGLEDDDDEDIDTEN